MIRRLGLGFDPTTTSGCRPPVLIINELHFYSDARNAARRAANVGVRVIFADGGGLLGSGPAGPRVNIPTPATCMSNVP